MPAARSSAPFVTTGKRAGSLPPARKSARRNPSSSAGSTIFACALRERVQTLQESGYSDAQLYDPKETSVGGIHAFFLFLGEPEAYGLPPKPQIPTIYLKSSWSRRVSHRHRRHRDGRSGLRLVLGMPNERARNFEDRLDALRQEAKHGITGRGVDVAGGPIPRSVGYYGEAVVKPPVWTWEIPLYFFVGGAAGMAPLIACAGLFLGQLDLMRAALWIAGCGAIISPVLLVMDLGRPMLFSQHAARFQAPLADVGRRLDSLSLWRVRGPGLAAP